MLDFIELRRSLPAEHVTAWLGAHGIDPAPIIHSAPGSLQFPVRASEPPAARYAPLSRGGVLRHGPESFVSLPPSRRIDGHVTTWLQPFDERTVMLSTFAVLRLLSSLRCVLCASKSVALAAQEN
jgi:hypothetical protein